MYVCTSVFLCAVCAANMIHIDQPAGTYPTNETEVADGMMLATCKRASCARVSFVCAVCVASKLYIDQPAGLYITASFSGYPTNETEVANGMMLAICNERHSVSCVWQTCSTSTKHQLLIHHITQ